MDLIELGERAAVEQFHDGRLHAGPAHGEDAGRGAAEVRVEGGDGVDVPRQVLQPHGDADHDPQRPLRADEQPGEVVAGDALERLVAGVDEASRPRGPTSSASTESRVTPYLAQRSPPALVATLPPMVDILKLAGSGAYISPCTAAAAFRSALTTPGSTTAVSSSGLRSRMRFIRSRREHHAALARVGAPGDPGSGAARHERDAMGGAGTHSCLHVGHRFGEDHGLRS